MMVSFIIPAYKGAYLAAAIKSILEQSYTDIELIIVNDKSPEDLDSVVASFNDPRIRYYKNETNLGGKSLVCQWNYCITLARGEYLVMAADDDIYAPEFAKECVALFEKYPMIDLVRSRVKVIDERGALLAIDTIMPEYTNKYQYAYYWLTGQAITCMGNFMFRTAKIQEKAFMDFPCAFGTDIATPIEMSFRGVGNTADMLFAFRESSIHLSSNTTRIKDKIAGITQLSRYLRALDYTDAITEEDRYYSSFLNDNYLQSKCIYDYYGAAIRLLPLNKFYYIKYCELASVKEKCVMAVRFLKDKLIS